MATKTDFTSASVAHGFRRNELAGLPEKTKKKLTRLMARISEASFRRGMQHGSGGIGPLRPGINLAKWRFRTSLDSSRPVHTTFSKLKHTAVDRLYMEYGVLKDIGLRE